VEIVDEAAAEFCGIGRTKYDVIADPPSDPGAAQLTVTVVVETYVAAAITSVG
jgi:hypothetical protein